MKTISIPEYNNPFTVNINNKEYIYKAGATIEVPDEVAEAIEDALELVPKPKRYLSKIAQRVEGSITELAFNDLDGIEAVNPYAFNYCNKLASVEIPNSARNIGEGAFFGCSGLGSVRFGDNSKLESIGTGAFGRCGGLESVFLPETPPSLANVDTFANINTACVFYCKTQASLNAYKAATNWSTLTGTYSFVVEE